MTEQPQTMSFSDIIKGPKPVLVDFYADWCMPCKMMTPILKELKTRMGDDIDILKIDAEKNPTASIHYQVRGVPTLILFKDGYVLWQQAGVVQASQLETIIRKKISDYELN
jgi:thioredoxin 1